MVGPPAAVLLAAGAVLADLGVRGLARHAGRSGPRSWSPGLSFAIPQYLVSNFHGPWLVDVVAALVSMGALVAVPARVAAEADLDVDDPVAAGRWRATPRGAAAGRERRRRRAVVAGAQVRIRTPPVPRLAARGSCSPSSCSLWGAPQFKAALDEVSVYKFPVDGLAPAGRESAAGGRRRRRQGSARSTRSTGCRRPAPASCWRPSSRASA